MIFQNAIFGRDTGAAPFKESSRSRLSRMRRGFSFTELLFAVMILGIGFIMIAAIFPVGLSQTKANFDETIAATTARQAVAVIEKSAKKADFTATSLTPIQTLSQPNTTLSMLGYNNMILPSDPRYAWVGLYRRTTTQAAQVIVFVVNRSDPFEKSKDLTPNRSVPDSCRLLEARPVVANLSPDGANVSNVAGPDANQYNAFAAGPGAFLVVSTPNLTTANLAVRSGGTSVSTTSDDVTAANARVSGSIYRLGNVGNGTVGFEWYPGYGFDTEVFSYVDSSLVQRTVTVTSMPNAGAYIVGRNRVSTTTNGAGDFEGSVMDVACYASFISLK